MGALRTGNPPEPPQHRLFSLFLSLGHAIFKLTYLSNHDYKHLYFESDAATINEIVLKVSVLGPGARCAGPASTRFSGLAAAPPPDTAQGSEARVAEEGPTGEHPPPEPHHGSAALHPPAKQDPLRPPPNSPVILILCIFIYPFFMPYFFPSIHCQEPLEAPGIDTEEIFGIVRRHHYVLKVVLATCSKHAGLYVCHRVGDAHRASSCAST